MSRNFFGLEKGVDIYAENGALQARILSGTAVPDGLGDQGTAPIGSIYLRSGTGELYQKIANAGNSADYQLNGAGSASVGTWRPESVVAVTNEVQGAGTRDMLVSPFTDDEGTALPVAAFVVNKYVITDADGTPALLRISAVAGDDVTFVAAANPLVTDDTFVAQYYLPDVASGENKAIVNYNGSVIVKISDIDWQIATGINLSGSYAAASGNVAPADTVEAAIAKLDGVNDNQDTLLGTAQGATNLGTFTGTTIPDSSTVKGALQSLETAQEEIDQNVNDLITLSGVAENATTLGTFTGATIPDSSTVKAALQSLETAHEEVDQNVNDLITLSGVAENATDFGTFTGLSLADNQDAKELFQRIEVLLEQMRGVQVASITTVTTVDSVPHASVKACKWMVEVFEIATPANRQAMEVYALNNGSAVDETIYSKLKTGSNFNLSITVDISGADMRLRAASSSAGVTVTARRIEVVKSVL